MKEFKMNITQLKEAITSLSPNYQRTLTKFKQDPNKFASSAFWAKPIVDGIAEQFPDKPFVEAIYMIKNDITEVPKCLFCGTDLKLITEPRHHYGKFCNNVCSAKHREASKKVN